MESKQDATAPQESATPSTTVATTAAAKASSGTTASNEADMPTDDPLDFNDILTQPIKAASAGAAANDKKKKKGKRGTDASSAGGQTSGPFGRSAAPPVFKQSTAKEKLHSKLRRMQQGRSRGGTEARMAFTAKEDAMRESVQKFGVEGALKMQGITDPDMIKAVSKGLATGNVLGAGAEVGKMRLEKEKKSSEQKQQQQAASASK